MKQNSVKYRKSCGETHRLSSKGKKIVQEFPVTDDLLN